MIQKYALPMAFFITFLAHEAVAVGISPPMLNLTTTERTIPVYLYNTKDIPVKLMLFSSTHEISVPSTVTLDPWDRKAIELHIDAPEPGQYKVYVVESDQRSSIQQAVVLKVNLNSPEEEPDEPLEEEPTPEEPNEFEFPTTTTVIAMSVVVLGAIAYGVSFL